MAKPKLPEELLNLIGNELYLLWAQMDTYQELYLIEQDKRQNLMNETAPGFFILMQATLAESIFMRIARLLDPAEQGGNSNYSIEALWLLLAKEEHENESASRSSLRMELRKLIDDWSPCRCGLSENRAGKYDRLKKLRNKMLAHNDFTQRKGKPANELWAGMTKDDYALLMNLTERAWKIYCQSYYVIRGSNALEPIYADRENRSSKLLEHMCSSLYLDHLLGNECDQRVDELKAFTLQRMGDDRIHPVFSDCTSGSV
jgi:hypothetical protein